MIMKCFCYGKDHDGTDFAIFQTSDGRMCRADYRDWNGEYSGIYGSTRIDFGFVCDSRDFDRIRVWFDDVDECIRYLRARGFNFTK